MSGYIKKAILLAKKELRLCYDKYGILAGRHHFTDYWARDGFFASFGALAIKDSTIVKKMVELFLSNQREDGLIPYRIMNGPITLGKYFGKHKTYHSPRPTYKLRGLFQEVYDGTTLIIIVLSGLGLKGSALSEEMISKVKLALSYLKKKERHGLLWDGVMAEWNDAVYKYGNLLYSNILYWYAYQRFNQYLKKSDKSLVLKQQEIGEAIRARLWNREYFADWHDNKRRDYFYPFGNLLAVSFGLATQEEARSILKKSRETKTLFTLPTNTPRYPLFRVDIQHLITGMGGYHNDDMLWWQPGLAYVAALAKTDNRKEAMVQLNIMSRHALKYAGFYECYRNDGTPVKKWLYRSEHPFAWSSGQFLWAAEACNQL